MSYLEAILIKLLGRAITRTTFVVIISFFIQNLFGQVPNISSFTPTSGVTGSAVTITGTGFSNVPSNNIVYVGGIRATVSVATPSSLFSPGMMKFNNKWSAKV